MGWSKEEHDELVKLKNNDWTYREIAELLSEKFNRSFSFDSVRNRWRRSQEVEDKEELPPYKESFEIKGDGTQVSDKLVELSEAEMKDDKYILLAHGYDPSKWEVVNVKVSRWHYRDKESKDAKISYATKLTAKPKKDEETDIDKILQAIKENKPFHMDNYLPMEGETNLLEIPLYDMHFGVNDYDYYKDTQTRVIDKISKPNVSEVVLVIGQDTLHTDNFKGTTSNFTPIQQIDVIKAWNDADRFFSEVIQRAMEFWVKVKVVYSPGNHDQTISWAFVKMLEAKYPQITFDTEMEQWKIHVHGESLIGFTHGDKARKNIHNVFMAIFPMELGKAKNKELHCGHLHIEEAIDRYGIMVRGLSTRNKTDEWHKQNGFVGAHKRFQLFEYSKTDLECIHYV